MAIQRQHSRQRGSVLAARLGYDRTTFLKRGAMGRAGAPLGFLITTHGVFRVGVIARLFELLGCRWDRGKAQAVFSLWS